MEHKLQPLITQAMIRNKGAAKYTLPNKYLERHYNFVSDKQGGGQDSVHLGLVAMHLPIPYCNTIPSLYWISIARINHSAPIARAS